MKKTLMITGASGFIGSNFIRRYRDEYNIIPMDLLKTKPEEIDWQGIDSVLHLAALVHQMKGAPEERYYEVNTELTRKVAQSAKSGGVGHFVFYSTVKVYGFDGEMKNHEFVLTENSECTPNDPYGGSKYEAEKLLRAMSDESFKVAMVRPPMVYGEGVKGNMLSLIKLVDRVPVIPFGYDNNRRTVVGIENLLHMTKLIIDKDADGIYLGSDGEPVSIKKIVETISEGLGKKRYLIKFPTPIFNLMCKVKEGVMVRLFGTLAFKQEDGYGKIGYVPVSGMREEIERMIKSYRVGR